MEIVQSMKCPCLKRMENCTIHEMSMFETHGNCTNDDMSMCDSDAFCTIHEMSMFETHGNCTIHEMSMFETHGNCTILLVQQGKGASLLGLTINMLMQTVLCLLIGCRSIKHESFSFCCEFVCIAHISFLSHVLLFRWDLWWLFVLLHSVFCISLFSLN